MQKDRDEKQKEEMEQKAHLDKMRALENELFRYTKMIEEERQVMESLPNFLGNKELTVDQYIELKKAKEQNHSYLQNSNLRTIERLSYRLSMFDMANSMLKMGILYFLFHNAILKPASTPIIAVLSFIGLGIYFAVEMYSVFKSRFLISKEI